MLVSVSIFFISRADPEKLKMAKFSHCTCKTGLVHIRAYVGIEQEGTKIVNEMKAQHSTAKEKSHPTTYAIISLSRSRGVSILSLSKIAEHDEGYLAIETLLSLNEYL